MQASLGEQTPATVFISYAHEDEAVRQELEKRLVALERKGILRRWDDRHITAGSEYAGEISGKLNSARLILFLVSPDFDASEFCNTVEVPRAMELHRAGEARVIPVLIRPTPNWEDTPYGKLQVLPEDGRPVSKWSDKDDAYSSIVKGIQRAIEAPPPVLPAAAALASRERRPVEFRKRATLGILRGGDQPAGGRPVSALQRDGLARAPGALDHRLSISSCPGGPNARRCDHGCHGPRVETAIVAAAANLARQASGRADQSPERRGRTVDRAGLDAE